MTEDELHFLRQLAQWLDGEAHRESCGFGNVVQSGPLAGNKIPCSCGLSDLQYAAERILR